MPYSDLRTFLTALERKGLMRWVTKEVDRNWEVGAIARTVFRAIPEEERFGVGFKNIKGCTGWSFVTGVVGASVRNVATALEVEPDPLEIDKKVSAGLLNPIPPKEVAKGPCKEVILKENDVDLNALPAIVWTPGRDPGPYLIPLWFTVDPETGVRNVGMYRTQVKGKSKVGIELGPSSHGRRHFVRWEEMGKSMPAAMVFGTEPCLYLTGMSKYQYGFDEAAAAGGIRGAPLEFVKCETIDMKVPAHAEVVIEGEFAYKEREREGPFGEYTGYMTGTNNDGPVFHVKCITHRRDPILQGVISQMPPSEGTTVRRVLYESNIMKHLRHDLHIPGIVDVYLPDAGGGRAIHWVSIKKTISGHVEQVAGAILGYLGTNEFKYIVICDDDVDIRDPFTREWVLAWRVRPEQDVHLIKGTPPMALDPSAAPPGVPREKRESAKVIIDATKKWEYMPASLPTKEYFDKVREMWSEYGLPELSGARNGAGTQRTM